MTVHAFYRAGSYKEEEANINSGVDTHRTILYAATSDETIGSNDYVVVGEWRLYYYGSGKNADILGGDTDAIRQMDALAGETPVAIYSVSGARLAAPQKGINIVKYQNGQTRKILVK